MKYFFMWMFFCILIFKSYSQNDIPKVDVLPTTPEAAAFEKYGNIPVGLFTGVPQINIPIHKITLKDISIPISLSYNSSGIKVDEIATNVGLGWVLNAGGLISCMTRGNPDFDTYGYVASGNISQTIYNDFKAGNYQEETINDGSPQSSYHITLNDIAAGYHDSEPDLFNYNLPNASGQFVYDETGVPRTVPFKPMRVQRLNGGASYKITDESGVEYTFGVRETALITSAPGSNCPVINELYPTANITPTWYLTAIATPYGEAVNFTYEAVSYSYEYTATEQDYIKDNVSNLSFGTGESCQDRPSLTCRNIMTVTGKRLKTISTSYGEQLSLNYQTSERLDLSGMNALNSISLQKDGSIINIWQFQYDYFNAGCTNIPDCYRLKLLSVAKNNLPAYQFEYDQTYNLPKRNAYSQDHWGYYNGKNNQTFLPQMRYNTRILAGADRDPSFNYTKAGILTQITYPIGGTTEFNYEANQYYFSGTETQQTELSSPVLSVNGNATGSPITAQFTITENVNALFDFDCVSPPNLTPGDFCVARLTGPNTDISYDYPNNPPPPESNTVYPSGGEYILQPGTYTISLYASISGFDADFAIKWIDEVDVTVSENRTGGGLRIKRIKDQPETGATEITRRYVYDNPSNQNSSGFISFEPDYDYVTNNRFHEIFNNEVTEYSCFYFTRGSQNIANNSLNHGNSVAYEYVTVLNGENGEFGKSTSQFSTYQDTGNNITTWPFVPPTSYDWIRGQLLQKTEFQNKIGIFSKVQEDLYAYEIEHGFNGVFENEPNENNILGLKVTTIRPYYLNGTQSFPSLLDINFYWTVSGWSYLKQKTSRLYSQEDETRFIETITDYFYDSPVHAQMTRSETTDSDGTLSKTKIYYPDDVTSTSSLGSNALSSFYVGEIQKMNSVNMHMIDKPIQTEVFEDQTLLSTGRYLYKEWATGQILMEKALMAKSSDVLEERLKYVKYDDHGNILEYQQTNGMTISMIWAYDGQYPVAEIKNATYSAVASALSYTETQLKNFDVSNINLLNGLRSSLPDTWVTTYEFDPLVGVTKITDPKGLITTYEYDDENRLKIVRDNDGKILTQHQYNYKNQ